MKKYFIPAGALVVAFAYLAICYAATWQAGQGMRPASSLDDAYIYFQYAKQFAQGHFFLYQSGAEASSGVTGLLYLLVLSALSVVGLEGPLAAWFIGTSAWLASLFLVLRLRARHFPELSENKAAALFMSLGPLTAAYFNGMETGLFCMLLLAVIEALGNDPKSTRAWMTMSLLALARPEGQLAAGIFGVWAFAQRGPRPWRQAFFLGLAIVTPSFLWLALTGSIVPDSVRGKSASFLSDPLDKHLIQSSEYLVGVIKGLFSGFYGAGETLGYGGGGSLGNPPSMLYPPLALPLSLWGFLAAKKRLAASTTGLPALALGIWCAMGLALQSWNIPVGWHQYRYLAIYAPALYLGAALALNELHQKTSKPALASVALILWLSFGAVSNLWHLAKNFNNTLTYRLINGSAALWLKENVPANEPVAVIDSGILAWESGHRIVDLPGVTDHRLSLAVQETDRIGSGPLFDEMLRRPEAARPVWAAIAWGRDDFDPSHWVKAGILSEAARIESPRGESLGLFRFNWSKLKTKKIS